jgi:hypothetical protein
MPIQQRLPLRYAYSQLQPTTATKSALLDFPVQDALQQYTPLYVDLVACEIKKIGGVASAI